MFKKILNACVICVMVTASAGAAVTINKAEPVQSVQSGGGSNTASLVPSVVELVTGVISLNQQQNLLTKDCEPTAADIAFVDNTIKEWAKTGQMTAEQAGAALRREKCGTPNCYRQSIMVTVNTPGLEPQYDYFNDPGKIWNDYPRVGSAYVCKKGAVCASDTDRDMVTDLYDIFNLIDFGPADYTPTESTTAAKLLGKMESCSKAKLSARKKELWGEFLANTASNLGQPTNTGGIMDQIGDIVQSGGVGALSSIGGIATGMFGQ